MANSFVQAFPDEHAAFVTFAGDHPYRPVLLVDTYDTLTGVARAIEVIQALGLEESAGVRLDSGDLAALAWRTRELLDDAGLASVEIFVSGGLDEHDLARYVADKVPIDAAGIGTKLGVSADAPYLDTVYKLVAYADRPVVKLSPGKATLPGPKQVFREPGPRDTIVCRDELPPHQAVPLLEQVMTGGRRTGPAPTMALLRSRVEAQLQALPDEALALVSPVAPVPATSRALRDLDKQVRAAAGATA
jgi:nicotinate phosphoribosyltransferase